MQRPRERLGDNIPLFRSRGGGPSIEVVSRLIDDSGSRLFRPENLSIQTKPILELVLNAGNTPVSLIRRILPYF